MVNLSRTDRIKDAIALYNKSNDNQIGEAPFVSHGTLARLALSLDVSFAELLRGAAVYVPPKPEKKKDPAYEQRMNRLRVRLEEQEYQSMIATRESYSFMDGFDRKELKNQLSVIINVLFSVASVAFAVWTWAAASLDVGKRLLLTMFAGLIVLVAEVSLYLGYIQKIADAKKEEALKKEVKKVVASTAFQPAQAQIGT